MTEVTRPFGHILPASHALEDGTPPADPQRTVNAALGLDRSVRYSPPRPPFTPASPPAFVSDAVTIVVGPEVDGDSFSWKTGFRTDPPDAVSARVKEQRPKLIEAAREAGRRAAAAATAEADRLAGVLASATAEVETLDDDIARLAADRRERVRAGGDPEDLDDKLATARQRRTRLAVRVTELAEPVAKARAAAERATEAGEWAERDRQRAERRAARDVIVSRLCAALGAELVELAVLAELGRG